MQNTEASPGSGQFCINNQCGPIIGIPAASSSSPGIFSVELNYELTSSEGVDTYFQWSSESSNQSGVLEINSDLRVEPYWQESTQTVMLVIITLLFIVFIANRLWGIDSQKP